MHAHCNFITSVLYLADTRHFYINVVKGEPLLLSAVLLWYTIKALGCIREGVGGPTTAVRGPHHIRRVGTKQASVMSLLYNNKGDARLVVVLQLHTSLSH